MTSRDRVLSALDHKPTDRVPVSLGLGVNLPVRRELLTHLGLSDLDAVEHYLLGYSDLRWIAPLYTGPASRMKTDADGTEIDVWGVVRKPISYGAGEYNEICHYPLAAATDVQSLLGHQWPDAGWWDVDDLRERISALSRDEGHAIVLGNGNIFERSWYMRGFEQMFMDLIERPDLAWAILERVTDYFVAFFDRVLGAADGDVDIVFTADDLGGQHGLLMSLPMWEKMLKPHHVRLNKVLHDHGVRVMYHTDGAVMGAIPGLIDMGVDILEAIQFDADGMDASAIKTMAGERLCFHGGVSVQQTLPRGSVADVRQEVRERVRVLGRGGGYVAAPSHAIQAGTPPENVVAFLETASDPATAALQWE